MKTIKFFIVCLLLGVVMPVLQSCSDDDKVEANDLYGKWQAVREEGYYKENGKIVEEWDDDVTQERTYIDFEKDGTFTEWAGNRLQDEGTWRLKGSTLTLFYDDEDYEFTLKIEKLTSTTLVIVEEDFDDGDYIYQKITFTRVD